MKKIFLLIMFVLSVFSTRAQEGKHIVILHTNDLHSRLYGFAPESEYSPAETGNDKTVGGFSRIASIIKEEKAKNPGITLAIDGGDFLMGTLFHALEANTGFQLRLMRQMGYDIAGIGNHEFDFGPERLAEIISVAEKNGPVPSLILSNASFSKKKDDDDSLEDLYSSGTIRRKIIIERDGLKIGVFALLGKDAADVAPRAEPVSFYKNIPFARGMVRELKNEGCNFIICISHSGIGKDKKGEWSGEDVMLARSVSGIDLIVSGHTHTKLQSPLVVDGVPVVQTGEYGEYVGRIEFVWTNGKPRMENYRLIPVDDNIKGDATVEDQIDAQKNIVEKDILEPLKIKYFSPVAETDFGLECNEYGDFRGSNLGPLVADAIYNYINSHSDKGCDISMVAVGVIRDKIVPGVLTPPDVFRIMSLGSGSDNVPGYPLARVYVTGRELKSVLEILQVAYKSSPSNYCFYSGFRAELDPDRGFLRKIGKIEILHNDGTTTEVDYSKRNKTLYSIAANSYMLEFIGIIKKMSFGLINVTPKDSHGEPLRNMNEAVIDMDAVMAGTQEGKEWLALMELLKSMNDTDKNGIPEIDRKYTTSVPSFTIVGK
jgi:5'-nucleotidase